MIKVTKKTILIKMKNHEDEVLNKTGLLVQCKNNDGSWSSAKLTRRFGNETNEEILERLSKLNNKEYRIAK